MKTMDYREEKREKQRELSRHLTFEERLRGVFELTTLCLAMREAFRENESGKGIQKPYK